MALRGSLTSEGASAEALKVAVYHCWLRLAFVGLGRGLPERMQVPCDRQARCDKHSRCFSALSRPNCAAAVRHAGSAMGRVGDYISLVS